MGISSISPRIRILALAAVVVTAFTTYQVFAATTVGTNFSTTGNLTVGDGTPTVTMDGEDSYVEGTFEVDGASRFDGAVTVGASGITFSDTTTLTTAPSSSPSRVTKNFTVATGQTITAGSVVGYLNNTVSNGHGNSILESEKVFESASSDYISAAVLDSTHFVVAYKDVGNSNYGTAIVGVVSGSTITYGTAVVFESANSVFISVAVLDSTHFVVAYQDGGNSSYGTAVVGVTNGATTISSFGVAVVFESANSGYISVAALDSTHFVVAYKDGGNSNYGTAVVGVTNGATTISSFGVAVVFESANSDYISVAVLNSTHFVVAYRDVGNSNYGTAIVGVTDGATTIGVERGNPIGIAAGAGTAGSLVSIILSGVSNVHSGLTAGTLYYGNINGTVGTTAVTSATLGKAISATEILLRDGLINAW